MDRPNRKQNRICQVELYGICMRLIEMEPNSRQMDGEIDPSWDSVRTALALLPSKGPDQGLSLEIGDNSWIIIYYVPDYGFLITIAAVGERDYFTLVNSLLGSECKKVWCAGEYMLRQRFVFVDKNRAEQSLKHYYETGFRDQTLEWMRDDDCWCR